MNGATLAETIAVAVLVMILAGVLAWQLHRAAGRYNKRPTPGYNQQFDNDGTRPHYDQWGTMQD